MSRIIGPANANRLFTPKGGSNNPANVDVGAGFTSCPYDVIVVDLSTVFSNRLVQKSGTVLWVEYATASTATAQLSYELDSNPQIQIYPTFKLEGFPFNQFYLSNNTAQAGVSLWIFTSTDLNTPIPQIQS